MQAHTRTSTSSLARQVMQQFEIDMDMLRQIGRPLAGQSAGRLTSQVCQQAPQDRKPETRDRATRPQPKDETAPPAKNDSEAAAPKKPEDDPTEARFKDAAKAQRPA